ncbi:hypothetical protein PCE1_004072 [Barthelona sp. PCE]
MSETSRFWNMSDKRLLDSTTVYVGNISQYCTEDQLYMMFSSVGRVNQVIIGRFKNTGHSAGFGFVIFENHESCLRACRYFNNCRHIDKRIIVDMDVGYSEGREIKVVRRKMM